MGKINAFLLMRTSILFLLVTSLSGDQGFVPKGLDWLIINWANIFKENRATYTELVNKPVEVVIAAKKVLTNGEDLVYNARREIQKWEEDFSVVEPNDFINLKNSLTKIIDDAFSLLEVFIEDLASILYPFVIYRAHEVNKNYLEPYLRAIIDFLQIGLVQDDNH